VGQYQKELGDFAQKSAFRQTQSEYGWFSLYSELMNLPSQENISEKSTFFKVGDLVRYYAMSDGDGAWLSPGSYGVILKISVELGRDSAAQVHWLDGSGICFICCSYLRIIS